MSIVKTLLSDKAYLKHIEDKKKSMQALQALQAKINQEDEAFSVVMFSQFPKEELQKEKDTLAKELETIKARQALEAAKQKEKHKQEDKALKEKHIIETEHLEVALGALGMKAKKKREIIKKNSITDKAFITAKNQLFFYQKGIDTSFMYQIKDTDTVKDIYTGVKNALLDKGVSYSTANSTAYHIKQRYMEDKINRKLN